MYAALLMVYGVLAPAIGAYGVAQAHLLLLAWRGGPSPPTTGTELPVVTVQLPVYNEAPVTDGLLRAIAALD